MSTTPNRSYPIPDPANAIHPGVRDALMAIDADVAGIVAGGGSAVTSVFGRTGGVIAAANDYTFLQIDRATSSLADITTRSAGDLNSGTLLAARMPALTGDVTSTVGTVGTTIANNAVTLAKLADIATASFLGRNTGGTGDPEVLSIATAKTMLGLTGSNTGDVTLAGENYLSIAGQVITALAINLSGTHVTSTLPAAKGGTGQSSYAIGDLLYASASTTLSKLADVATGNALISGGVGAAPSWGKIDLTSHVSNVLPVVNGGTGQSTYTNGQLLIGNTTGNTLTKATLTGTANQVVVTNGTGSITLSLPQDIHTGASPSFVGLTLSGNANISGFVGHPSYVSQTTNWRIDSTGGADFRYLFTDELHAKSFIADLEQALAGGQIITKSVGVLGANFTAPAAGATATLTIRDLPSAPNMAAFESGDYVRLRTFTRSAGSLTITDCWGIVTSYTDQAGGLQTWTFTRGSGANAGGMTAGTVIQADAIVLDYGVSGNGFYEVNAIDGVYGINSPYAQIVTWTTSPIAANQVLRTRFGNLRGVTGVTDEYGMVAGTYSATNGQYLRASNSAFELHGINLLMWEGTTNVMKLDRAAPSFAIGSPVPTAYGTGTGIWMGRDGAAYKFRVGVPGGGGLFWDGTTMTVAGWTISTNYMTSSNVFFAASADTSVLALSTNGAWMGRGASGYYGLHVQDSSNRYVRILGNHGTRYPYLEVNDGTRARVVLGGLNNAWGSDGSTDSMGLKIFNSSGALLVKFADTNVIAGWTIGATSISSGSGATTVAMDSGGTNPAFYAGSATPGSAPFRVTNAGALTATNATITGAVTATSGAIGGWTIASTKLSSTGIDIHSGANAALSFGTTPPASASSGTGMWFDRLGLVVVSSGQGLMGLSTGGIEIAAGPTKTSRDYRFVDNLAGDYLGGMHCIFSAGTPAEVFMVLEANTGSGADTTGVLINCHGGTSKIELKTSTTGAGARDNILINGGMVMGNASGGAKGLGTINISGDIYKGGNVYNNPDFVFEHWATGKIEKFAHKDGASTYNGLRPLSEVREFVRENYHLPGFGQKAGHGIFSGSEQLLLAVEQAYLYIFALEQQLKELKGDQWRQEN